MFRKLLLGLSLGLALTMAAPSYAAKGPVLLKAKLTLLADPKWTASEQKTLKQHLAKIYPALVSLYGEPAKRQSYTLKKVGGDQSQIQTTVTFGKDGSITTRHHEDIELSTDALKTPKLIAHELAHGFHDQYVIEFWALKRESKGAWRVHQHDALEEGMAQAASNLVAMKLGYDKDNTQVFAVSGSFIRPEFQYHHTVFATDALYPIRLNMAAWAFTEWERAHPGFLRRFNQQLYQAKKRLVYSEGWQIAEKITPGAAKWFKSQLIFTPATRTGDFLYCFGDGQKLGAGLYRRTKDGSEQPLANQPVRITIGINGRNTTNLFTTKERGNCSIMLPRILSSYSALAAWGSLTSTFSYP